MTIHQRVPAGFVQLVSHAVSADVLRKNTTNILRFQTYLPLARRLYQTDAGSVEAIAIYEQAGESLALMMTLAELGIIERKYKEVEQ